MNDTNKSVRQCVVNQPWMNVRHATIIITTPKPQSARSIPMKLESRKKRKTEAKTMHCTGIFWTKAWKRDVLIAQSKRVPHFRWDNQPADHSESHIWIPTSLAESSSSSRSTDTSATFWHVSRTRVTRPRTHPREWASIMHTLKMREIRDKFENSGECKHQKRWLWVPCTDLFIRALFQEKISDLELAWEHIAGRNWPCQLLDLFLQSLPLCSFIRVREITEYKILTWSVPRYYQVPVIITTWSMHLADWPLISQSQSQLRQLSTSKTHKYVKTRHGGINLAMREQTQVETPKPDRVNNVSPGQPKH